MGRQPLGTQPWTERLIVTLNAVLPEAQSVDASTTGHAVLGAIFLLPERERQHLLESDVNPLDGSLVYTEVKAPPAAAPVPATDANAESFHRQILRDLMADGRRTFLIVLAIGFVVISVVIVALTASLYDQHSKHTNIFMRILRAILDFLDALTGNFQPNNDYTPQ